MNLLPSSCRDGKSLMPPSKMIKLQHKQAQDISAIKQQISISHNQSQNSMQISIKLILLAFVFLFMYCFQLSVVLDLDLEEMLFQLLLRKVILLGFGFVLVLQFSELGLQGLEVLLAGLGLSVEVGVLDGQLGVCLGQFVQFVGCHFKQSHYLLLFHPHNLLEAFSLPVPTLGFFFIQLALFIPFNFALTLQKLASPSFFPCLCFLLPYLTPAILDTLATLFLIPLNIFDTFYVTPVIAGQIRHSRRFQYMVANGIDTLVDLLGSVMSRTAIEFARVVELLEAMDVEVL